MQGEHPELLLVAAVGRELAALAEEDDAVDAVPRLDQVQALLNLALQVAVTQVAGDEDRLLCAAELEHRLVDGL